MMAAPPLHGSVRDASCQANLRSFRRSSLSRIIVGPRLGLLGHDVTAGRSQRSHCRCRRRGSAEPPRGVAMRNAGGRRGRASRLLDSGRGLVAITAPWLISRCGDAAAYLAVWRDMLAQHLLPGGPWAARAQSARLRLLASSWHRDRAGLSAKRRGMACPHQDRGRGDGQHRACGTPWPHQRSPASTRAACSRRRPVNAPEDNMPSWSHARRPAAFSPAPAMTGATPRCRRSAVGDRTDDRASRRDAVTALGTKPGSFGQRSDRP
jgi:hypothetical protein